MKGRLKDRPLDILLHEFQVRARSGVLTLERAPWKQQLCFLKGTVRFAASNLREDRLAEYIARSAILPEEAVREIEARTPQGHRLRDTLLAEGLVTLEQVRDLARAHVLDLVLPCFEWKSGEYRFEEGVPNIVGEIATDIPAIEFALERSRRTVTEEQIQKIEKMPHASLSLSGLDPKDVRRMRLTQMETLVLARAEERESVGETLAVAPSLRHDLTRAVAVLVAGGIVSTSTVDAVCEPSAFDAVQPGLRTKGADESKELLLGDFHRLIGTGQTHDVIDLHA